MITSVNWENSSLSLQFIEEICYETLQKKNVTKLDTTEENFEDLL